MNVLGVLALLAARLLVLYTLIGVVHVAGIWIVFAKNGWIERIVERLPELSPRDRLRFVASFLLGPILVWPLAWRDRSALDEKEIDKVHRDFRRTFLDGGRFARALVPQMPAQARKVLWIQHLREGFPDDTRCTRQGCQNRAVLVVLLSSRCCAEHGMTFSAIGFCTEHESAAELAAGALAQRLGVEVEEAPFAHNPWKRA